MTMEAGAAIDLRSDTVTLPTAMMREAMGRAAVGDDQYGEDPSVNQLEAQIAGLLGKEAAVFMASGTMTNQAALRVLARPGDEVLVGGEAHVLWHETGAAAANAGVQINPIGRTGLFTADEFCAACKPRGHMVFPPTGMVVIENTHNRGGGVVFPQDEAVAVCEAAERLGIAAYLDGARLFNAACASGLTLGELAAPFRMVSVALSKGLGCPVGSVLAGRRDDIAASRRVRRMFGGAMRQAGILAAAGLYALEHHVERLAEDHANARILAAALARAPAFEIDLATVQTNIVMFHTTSGAANAASVVARAKALGVLVVQFGPRTIRATTHLSVDGQQCRIAGELLVQAGSCEPG